MNKSTPSPVSLVVIVGIFVLLIMYMRKKMIKKMDTGIGGGIFGSGVGSDKLKYYCMNCGAQHNQVACPKCGSKMKRVGS